MGKIIFLDVDGTLVDYENRLPSSAVKAIRQARSNGHRVYICTGRSRAEVYPELWDIGLDGMKAETALKKIKKALDTENVVDDINDVYGVGIAYTKDCISAFTGPYMPANFELKNGKVTSIGFFRS